MKASPTLQDKIDSLCYCIAGSLDERATVEMTMTDATEAIWGTSGRGNPNAVRKIEALSTFGYVKVRRPGKRARFVSITEKGREAAKREAKAIASYRVGLEARAR